jgi:phosphoribosylglycinamide formyltransferase-1
MMSVVVFASGRGSNAENIFALAKEHPTLIKVEALVCNRSKAGVIEHAQRYGIPYAIIPVPKLKDRTQRRIVHEQQIHEYLSGHSFSYICLAGYMRVFTPSFVSQYRHSTWPVSQIINIHPALLPSFPGTAGYKDAFSYGVHFSGVTTHFVDEGVDTGPIIHQRIIKRNSTDTLEDFSTRGLQQEYQCYRETLYALATNQVAISHDPFHIFLNTVEPS